MIDNTAIENALIAWANGKTATLVIIANESKPRPAMPYISIAIPAFLPVGTAGKTLTGQPTDLVKIESSTTFDILVSLNFYRSGAFANALILRDSFDSVSVIETLETAGLFFISTSDIRYIPDVINKEFEERYQMDISFYIRSLSDETIEQIKKIEITNELDDTTIIVE